MKRWAFAILPWLIACGHGGGSGFDAGTNPADSGTDGGAADAGVLDGGFDAGLNDGGIPPLTLTQLLPPRGPSGGSTPVTVKGSAFVLGVSDTATGAQKLSKLTFGGNSVLYFQIIDDNTIDVETPPGIAGPADVTLTNPNGTVTCRGCFTYFDPLDATSVSPTSGPARGGNTLTITGSGFTPGVTVLVGGQSSPQVTLVSSTEVQAVVPRAVTPGQVDVVVFSQNGITTLRHAYQYFPDLRVTSVSPLTGPLAGGTPVTLTGQAFDSATSVTFGGLPGSSLAVVNSNQLTVTTPAAVFAGAVNVTVTTPIDTWTVRNGFTYVDTTTPFAAYGVFPHVGPSAGGDAVTVTGAGLGGLATTGSVTFGGAAASVVSASANAVVVNVPAQPGAAAIVDVVVSNGASSVTLTGGYTYQLQVASISPTAGPAAGGTPATVAGSDLPADATVFLGSLQATVTGAVTPAQVPISTPAGSGGAPSDVWVYSAGDPENEAVLPAAFTYLEALGMGRVQPNSGAIAGGTLVSVIGTGFGPGTVVSFGANIAKDIKVIDTHTLSCRTPSGDVGTVDVTALRLGEASVAPGAFSYFDPSNISGGLSGGPLIGTINVTVLDGTLGFYGNPIPLANVMLGVDSFSPFQGQTDDRGQITFSDPSLVKPQIITAWKDGYEATTITSVTTENVTILLVQTGGGGNPNPPPPPPPAAIISGKVTGFKTPRPLQSGESLQARVFLAETSFYDGPPYSPPFPTSGETWLVNADGDGYTLYSNSGIVATYAIFGITSNAGMTFEPFLMGTCRGISADPALPVMDANIILDTHLDMTVPVTIQGALSIDGGAVPNNLYGWLNLGDEGFIPNPNNWNTGMSASTSIASTNPQIPFPDFPTLDGSNFVFLNVAESPNGYPQSFYFTSQPGDLTQGLTIGPMYPMPVFTDPTAANTVNGWDGIISWSVDPGPSLDITQVSIIANTMNGSVTAWTIVLPGSQTQVQLPAATLQDLQTTYAGDTMLAVLQQANSPKFDYNQWTYDVLSGQSWTAYTIALSDSFNP